MTLTQLRNRWPRASKTEAGAAAPYRAEDCTVSAGGVAAPLSRVIRERGSRNAQAIRAEVRLKRFATDHVEDDRFDTLIHAAESTPYALLAALVESGIVVDQFQRPTGTDERVLVQITAWLS